MSEPTEMFECKWSVYDEDACPYCSGEACALCGLPPSRPELPHCNHDSFERHCLSGGSQPEREVMNKWVPTTNLLILRRMGKLQEEMGELLEVTGRVIIQGIDKIDPGTGVVNRERITKEIADVYAQLDETVARLRLDAESIAGRRAHKRSLMEDWEALFDE